MASRQRSGRQELFETSFAAEGKVIVLSLAENRQGRFMQIRELMGAGRSDTITIPVSTIGQLQTGIAQVAEVAAKHEYADSPSDVHGVMFQHSTL